MWVHIAANSASDVGGMFRIIWIMKVYAWRTLVSLISELLKVTAVVSHGYIITAENAIPKQNETNYTPVE